MFEAVFWQIFAGRADMDIHLLPSLARSLARSTSPLPKCHVRYSCYCLRSPSLPPSLRAGRPPAHYLRSLYRHVKVSGGKLRRTLFPDDVAEIVHRRQRRASGLARPMRPPRWRSVELPGRRNGAGRVRKTRVKIWPLTARAAAGANAGANAEEVALQLEVSLPPFTQLEIF